MPSNSENLDRQHMLDVAVAAILFLVDHVSVTPRHFILMCTGCGRLVDRKVPDEDEQLTFLAWTTVGRSGALELMATIWAESLWRSRRRNNPWLDTIETINANGLSLSQRVRVAYWNVDVAKTCEF